MKLSELSVKRPVGVFILVLVVIGLGFFSLRNLAIDLFPDIDLPVAVVATSYPGAAPEDVERLVSDPIEGAVSSIEGVNTLQSTSSPEASLVLIQFDFGVNLDNAMFDVREAVDQVDSSLPEGAEEPSVMKFDPQQMPIMWVGLASEQKDLSELRRLAEDDIQPLFERQPGVAQAMIEGAEEREIEVQLDLARLSAYGLTTNDVLTALSSENQSASAGNIEKGQQELQLRVDGEFENVADIENTLIPLTNGESITVSDVATVVDTTKEQESITRVNNKPALVLPIMKQSDGNTVAVADQVRAAIADYQEKLPEDTDLSIVMDTSEFIQDSIDSVVNNLLMGAVLAVLVLWLFLHSIRATLVIGLSIPISVISTFLLMYFTGETVNILTMGGLALGVGMMVDSSIVLLENIFNYRQRGYSAVTSATDGATEIGPAIVASTMTTLVVFLPIVFIEGIAKELFAPLALTVSFSLLASLIVALTVVPMLSSKFLHGKVTAAFAESDERWFDRLFGKVKHRYRRLLDWALGHRKTVVFGTIGALILSIFLIPFIGAEFIPESDEGQISISVSAQSGSTLAETNDVTLQIQEYLQAYDDIIETSYVTVGSGSGGVPGSGGADSASLMIQLVDANERDKTTQEIVSELNEQTETIAGADITVLSASSSVAGSESPITVQISGAEMDVLQDLSEQVKYHVEAVEGTTNVETSTSEGRQQIDVEVNRDLALRYGLSYEQIMNQVSLSFNGQVATRYRDSGDEIDVQLILPDDERNAIEDLRNMYITTPEGAMIQLDTVAELTQTTGPTEIQRQNQERQVNVTSDVNNRTIGEVSADIQAALEQMTLPDGYSIEMGGQIEDMEESFLDLSLALIAAVFLVYAVMAIQFESMLYPFVIMFSMPATLIGILLGLFVTGTPLSVTAFIGFIMLAGIVVNNAIVLVDYINILRGREMERKEAVMDAGATRLRPILMTALTTILAMVPLALGLGEGSEAQAPMAIVIIFGLGFSTLFTLILIPVVYTYFDDLSNWLKRIGKRRPKQHIETDGTTPRDV